MRSGDRKRSPFNFKEDGMKQIRSVSLCVFLNDNRILVFEGHDKVKNETFYRPLGGGIEFGETADEAVRRELMEEIQAEVDDIRFLGALENIFTLNGDSYHEIVMIHDGVLKESGLYEQAVIDGKEANGEIIRAMWMRLDEFGEGKSILYPNGLLELLNK
jgi:8-oxo-dGTP pyrophosphatase MutT (NUDIX family)